MRPRRPISTANQLLYLTFMLVLGLLIGLVVYFLFDVRLALFLHLILLGAVGSWSYWIADRSFFKQAEQIVGEAWRTNQSPSWATIAIQACRDGEEYVDQFVKQWVADCRFRWSINYLWLTFVLIGSSGLLIIYFREPIPAVFVLVCALSTFVPLGFSRTNLAQWQQLFLIWEAEANKALARKDPRPNREPSRTSDRRPRQKPVEEVEFDIVPRTKKPDVSPIDVKSPEPISLASAPSSPAPNIVVQPVMALVSPPSDLPPIVASELTTSLPEPDRTDPPSISTTSQVDPVDLPEIITSPPVVELSPVLFPPQTSQPPVIIKEPIVYESTETDEAPF